VLGQLGRRPCNLPVEHHRVQTVVRTGSVHTCGPVIYEHTPEPVTLSAVLEMGGKNAQAPLVCQGFLKADIR